jgi:hypothetical protein
MLKTYYEQIPVRVVKNISGSASAKKEVPKPVGIPIGRARFRVRSLRRQGPKK